MSHTKKKQELKALKEGKLGKEDVSEASSDESETESIVEDVEVDESFALKDKKFELETKKGIICLRNIPHGFYEREMQQYFSQFGEVLRLRLSRNLRTFKPRGYAFIQFKLPEVADIVQKTMNGYIILENILRCESMDPSNVHDNIFHPSLMNRKKVDYKAIAIKSLTLPRTAEQKIKRVKRRLEREDEKRKKIKKLGIEYTFKQTEKLLSKDQLKLVKSLSS